MFGKWAKSSTRLRTPSRATTADSQTKRSSGGPYIPRGTSVTRKPSVTSSVTPVRKTSSRKLAQPTTSSANKKVDRNLKVVDSLNNESRVSKKFLRGSSALLKQRGGSSQSSLTKTQSSGKTQTPASSVGDLVMETEEMKVAAFEQEEEDLHPSQEKMSNDIAAAVAMIVAEYEMLKDKTGEDQGVEATPDSEEVGISTSITKTADASTGYESDHNANAKPKEAPQTSKKTPTPTMPESRPNKIVSRPSTPTPTAELKAVPLILHVNPPGTAVPAPQKQIQSSPLPNAKPKAVKKKESPMKIGKTPSIVTVNARKSFYPYPRSNATPPTPNREARLGGHLEVKKFLGRVQHYINALGYHRDGEPDTMINVRLSMKTQMLTARDVIAESRPIKCLHAVVLACYLTNTLDSVERFPIYFRSHVGEKEYKHIVLGIYYQGHYGALGISRDVGLQDKKLTYPKLTDLILEFAKCYNDSGHILNEVKLGNIVTHDQSSLEKLFSKIATVPIHDYDKADIEVNVERVAKQLRARMGLACLKSRCFDKVSPGPRRSRSKVSLRAMNVSADVSRVGSNANTAVGRPRAMSMGPAVTVNSSLVNSDEKLGTSSRNSKTVTQTRTKTKTYISSKPKKKSERV